MSCQWIGQKFTNVQRILLAISPSKPTSTTANILLSCLPLWDTRNHSLRSFFLVLVNEVSIQVTLWFGLPETMVSLGYRVFFSFIKAACKMCMCVHFWRSVDGRAAAVLYGNRWRFGQRQQHWVLLEGYKNKQVFMSICNCRVWSFSKGNETYLPTNLIVLIDPSRKHSCDERALNTFPNNVLVLYGPASCT